MAGGDGSAASRPRRVGSAFADLRKLARTTFSICLRHRVTGLAAEIGFFSVNDTKLRALTQAGNKRAAMALHLRNDPQRLLSTILVGDRLVDTATASIATIITLNAFGDKGYLDEAVAVTVGILTFVLLVFADIVPKTLAAKYAVPVALNMAYPVYGVQKVLSPILGGMVPMSYFSKSCLISARRAGQSEALFTGLPLAKVSGSGRKLLRGNASKSGGISPEVLTHWLKAGAAGSAFCIQSR